MSDGRQKTLAELIDEAGAAGSPLIRKIEEMTPEDWERLRQMSQQLEVFGDAVLTGEGPDIEEYAGTVATEERDTFRQLARIIVANPEILRQVRERQTRDRG